MRIVARTTVAIMFAASALRAQREPARLDIALPHPQGEAVAASDGPTIIATNVLRDSSTTSYLQHGFPTRLHYRLELWKKHGVLADSREATREWDVFVRYDVVATTYLAYQQIGTVVTELGQVTSIEAIEAIIDKPYHVLLGPAHPGDRYFYDVRLDVTALNVTDLDATYAWLTGEFRPAAGGKRNPFAAVLNFFKNAGEAALSRMLGKHDTYETHSGIFVAG